MNDLLNYVVFFGVLLLAAWPLSRLILWVYNGVAKKANPVEAALYKVSGIAFEKEMDWKQWAGALMILSLVKIAAVFVILVFQNYLPLNPQNLPGVPWDLALNTAVSFTTNTNWQNYGGESTMSYFSQMAALSLQNFLSAAAGIAVLFALVRGVVRRETKHLGNFWVDLVRINLYLLLPVSLVSALVLISQGAIQNLLPYVQATGLAGGAQTLPMGPLASQEAIKMLGTNGGGFFNANSAHPWENPTAFTNFFESILVFLIPTSLVFTFGRAAKDMRQSWAIFGIMAVLFTAFFLASLAAETAPLPHAAALGVDGSAGNLEGKETRFGVGPTVLFNDVTTATSCGAVDGMIDSYTPLGGMVPLVLIQVGEVIFGGVGSGLYGMIAMLMLTVFVGGLMVGRTPEYLGKKIESFDMKMIVVAVMITPFVVLTGTAVACLWHWVPSDLGNGGAHGFSEVFYAFSSMANNNGSAFAGLNGNTHFWNVVGALAMFVGRFGVMIPILALAGNLAQKKAAIPSLGTLPTHGLTFAALVVFFIIVVAALNFVPGLALGPLAEFFQAS
jgi:K+-transporting ATPase ATPase A chain